MAMDLSSLTADQRESVRYVTGPLLISAGAGSGKTFTLTQRIAYAFTPESGGSTGEPLVTDIDQVCAITYTDKAAQEIRARVKRTLYEQGQRAQALKVDAAWISTIHGMCSRILHTHALDLGLDPEFGVIGDKQREALIARAIDDVLREAGMGALDTYAEDGDVCAALSGDMTFFEDPESFEHASEMHARYAPLFRDYPAQNNTTQRGQAQVSVASMVEVLLETASNVRGGLNSIEFVVEDESASALARDLLLAYESIAGVLEGAGASATAERTRAGVANSRKLLEDFLLRNRRGAYAGNGAGDGVENCAEICAGDGASGLPDAMTDAHDEVELLARIFEHLTFVPRNFGSPAVKEAAGDFQQTYGHIAARLSLACARESATLLRELACKVGERFARMKREACVLDNNDLLSLTLDAFEQHPRIAERYTNRFKLVMVDEFQDTSQLQIDLIAHIAGENSCRLCTVGDSQQSIYRFRGADVNVYEAHKRVMRSAQVGARYVELAKNFRSHADILTFVDDIFRRPEAFGHSFMSLAPCEERASIWRGGPRINLVYAEKPAGKDAGVSARDLCVANAAAIADSFARMRERGHRGGEMVVLLGKMSNAEIYAQALRERGFECVIAKGSLFAKSREARVMVSLCKALAYEANTTALFEVLTSDLFALSANDLLAFATNDGGLGEEPRRRDFGLGFYASEGFAREVIEAAREQVRTEGLVAAMRAVVLKSGWLARLEDEGAEGIARAANVLKAMRLIESFEHEDGAGVASLVARVEAELSEGLKEAPGALVASQGETVRLLTIHSSKGLQFPIVAVADFDMGLPSFNKLVAEPVGQSVCASLSAGYSLDSFGVLSKRAGEYFAQARKCAKIELESGAWEASDAADESDSRNMTALVASDAVERRVQLMKHVMREERAEAYRLLYVALTRASEALVVALVGTEGAEPEALTGSLCKAFFNEGFPRSDSLFDFGGTEPASFTYVNGGGECDAACAGGADNARADDVGSNDVGTVRVVSTDSSREFLVAHLPDAPEFSYGNFPSPREGLFSYSSIAPHVPHGASAEEPPLSPAYMNDDVEPDSPRVRAGDDDCATDLGNAFHRIAQFAVEARAVPSRERIDAIARACGVSETQQHRLDAALAFWFSSHRWDEVANAEHAWAEVPFLVPVGDAQMEGQIDLLCMECDGESHRAVVVDYKTGGHADESDERIHAKHLLQAQCYAYAILLQGFSSVELHFVRVEQGNEAFYRFNAGELPQLETIILNAYASSRRQ